MDKKNLKVISTGIASTIIALLFITNYAKVTAIFGINEGVSFFGTLSYTPIMWLLVIVPVMMVAMPYIKVPEIKKQENILSLALPVVGFVLHIVLYFLLKNKVLTETSGLANINAGLGFYLTVIMYFALLAVNVMLLKGVDLGNEKLNSFVDKAADTANSTTGKVLETVDNIKNKE